MKKVVALEQFLKMASADAARAGVSVLQLLLSLVIMAVEGIKNDRPNAELQRELDGLDAELPPRPLKGGGTASPATDLVGVRKYLNESLDRRSLVGEVVQFCIDNAELDARTVGLAVFGEMTRPAGRGGSRTFALWQDVSRNAKVFRLLASAASDRVVYHEAWVRAEWPQVRHSVMRKLAELQKAAASATAALLKGGGGLEARMAAREASRDPEDLRYAVDSIDRWYERITGKKPAAVPTTANGKTTTATEPEEFETEEPKPEFEEEGGFEEPESELSEFEEFEEGPTPTVAPTTTVDFSSFDESTLGVLVAAGGQLAPGAAAELARRRAAKPTTKPKAAPAAAKSKKKN